MPSRLPLAALACILAFFAAAPGASAAPPASLLQDQISELRGGTAILQYRAQQRARRARLLRAVESTGAQAIAFRKLPMLAVRGSRLELRRSARLRGVVAAHMNQRLRYFTNESVPLIYRGAHDSAWESGFDGRGGSVAVVDSGVDGLHDDLDDRVTRNVKVVDPAGVFGERGQSLYVECPADCNTDTTSGHGTHVAGTASGDGGASDGFYTGVAPGSGVVGLGVGEGINVLYAVAALDYVLAHHAELNIVAVNNSWGSSGGRVDYSNPVNQATKALHDAGVSVVFAAGNSGPNGEGDPAGPSDCGTTPDSDGDGAREPSEGECMFNVYAAAPWVLAVAAGRKDGGPEPGEQKLAYFSSRGDPQEEQSLDGRPVSYKPALTAPGVNVRAARAPTGALQVTCGGSAEPASCVPPRPEYEPFYFSSSGTSMAAPHVAGAVAVIQSAAQARLGRRLTPDEVRQVLTASAAPMTSNDGYWDWPCGEVYYPVECGAEFPGTTQRPYEDWQIGAGYLDLKAALERVEAQPAPPADDGGPGPVPLPDVVPGTQSGGDSSGGGAGGDGTQGGGDQGTGEQGSSGQEGSSREQGTTQRRGARRRARFRRCMRQANRVEAGQRRRAARRRCRGRFPAR